MIIEFLSCTVSIVVPLLLQIYTADVDTNISDTTSVKLTLLVEDTSVLISGET